MRPTQISKLALALFVIALAHFGWSNVWLAPNAASAQEGNPPPIPAGEQPEALTRGPVHESFAEPIVTQRQEYISTPSEPPENIDETPPDDRPEGNNVDWVPGYWAWDADRNGHIWISGCWRVTPPQMSWVSGYWARTSAGWEWIPGFWTPASNDEIEYLSAPPEIVDVQPVGVATVVDTIWVPPCYYWVDGRYTLRRGYWMGAQEGWVWTPSHYIRTPRGYIFAAGHWDYELQSRGVLFAPVAFSAGYRVRSGFSYSPTIVINVEVLTVNMFVSPRYHHYYFGDYYDAAYITVGIYPRFDADRGRGCYDPIYQHDRWRHRRSDSRWEEHQRRDYDERRANVDLRPARTYREQEVKVAKAPEAQRRKMAVAQPLAQAVANKSTKMKFERVKPEKRAVIAQQTADSNKFREERRDWETKKSASAAPPSKDRPAPTLPETKGNVSSPPDRSPKPNDRSNDRSPASGDQGKAQTPAPNDRGNDRSPASGDQGKPQTPAPNRGNDRSPAAGDQSKPQTPASNDRAKDQGSTPSDRGKDSPREQADRAKEPAPQPREDSPGRPDKVKVRARPIADKPGSPGAPANPGNDRGAPASPSSEGDRGNDSRDSKRSEGKEGSPSGDGKDKQKGDSRDSNGKGRK